MHQIRSFGLSLVVLLILGCSRGENTETATPVAAPPAAAVAPENNQVDLAALDNSDLRKRAAQALHENNMYAPAGRNAVEYYLAMRDKAPGQPEARSALVDLQPYVLMANEQAIASGRLDEARRLVALLTRMDRAAAALPRLQQSLAAAEKALVAEGLRASQDAETLATEKQDAEQQAGQQAIGQGAPEPTRPTAAPVPAADGRVAASSKVNAAKPAGAAPAAPAALPQSAAVTPEDTGAIPAASSPTTSMPKPLPRLLKEVAPRYPVIALSRRIEGSVDVTFNIGADGAVSGARAVASRPARVFDQAALKAVSQWRFEATGESVTTTRTVNFTLGDQG